MTLEELQDTVRRFNKTRTERMALDKQSRTLKTVETTLASSIMDAMVSHGLTSLNNIKLVSSEKPAITDWNDFYGYIQDNGAFELLERRPHQKALLERREHGENLPGVTFVATPRLSVSKIS